MVEARFTFPGNFTWGLASSADFTPPKSRKGAANLARDIAKFWDERSVSNSSEWNEHQTSQAQYAFLLSVPWRDIEPKQHTWNDKAVAKYRRFAVELLRSGMIPFMYFDSQRMPEWIEERGGWSNDKTPSRFHEFIEKYAANLATLTFYWVIGDIEVDRRGNFVGLKVSGNSMAAAESEKSLNHFWQAFIECHSTLARMHPQIRLGVQFSPAYAPHIENRADQKFNSAFISGKDFLRGAAHRFARSRNMVGYPRLDAKEVRNHLDFSVVNFRPDLQMANGNEAVDNPKVKSSNQQDADHVQDRLWDLLKWSSGLDRPTYFVLDHTNASEAFDRAGDLALSLNKLWRAANFNWQTKGFFYLIGLAGQVPANGEAEDVGDQALHLQTLDVLPPLLQAVAGKNQLTSADVRAYAVRAETWLFSEPESRSLE